MDNHDPKKPQHAGALASVHSLPSSKSKPQSQSNEQSSPSQVEPLSLILMEKLWKTMVETYGHRWTANFGAKPRPDHAWAKHLTGITGKQIANGLAQLGGLNNDGWPPSATQFRSMCLQMPGMPSESEAWEQALRGEYSHDIVRIAAEKTGTFDLKSGRLTDKALRERFNRNFAIVRARAVMGKPLDDSIPDGIEHEEKTPMQVQYAHTHQQARDLITAQNIPTDGQQARKLLLARMGIKRGDQHA
ncbi:hypothetical protein SAMN05216575_106206 [Ectopseudomonas alcaliphila]|uniref:Phage replication protein P n=2 Tax=Ectopseudomonas alcaliphila TaxID=101564 RepID=A0A1G7JEG2_9GAMM|nr:hypothetical protein SAMN05216575_106206 [Pseudomonas alcaliphila]